jgi:hypothetical protein
LTEEQIVEVLSRAEEIHLREALADTTAGEFESVLRAAEELGLPRAAVERAIRERYGLPLEPPKQGDLAFAKSADGHYYVSDVVSVDSASARIRFVRGEEHSLPLHEVYPCAFLPGMKVVARWPFWGWSNVDVVSYNAAKKRVKVTDGWSDKTFSLADIRMQRPRPPKTTRRSKAYYAIFALGAIAGGAIGAIVTWFLTR